jgi:UDP-glucose 4-epimerase
MTVLLTGGAGYIGSHVARLLANSGLGVVVVDQLSGKASRLVKTPTLKLDLSDSSLVSALQDFMTQHKVTSVIHLAALKQVSESVAQPERYFTKNIAGLANLLTAMRNTGVNKLVFSSSAATYGNSDADLVTEDEATIPVNPYGQSKLIGEWMVSNAEVAWGLSHVSLRYFNVAGAGWPDLCDRQRLNLIPILLGAIKEGKKPVVFGNNYPTPDGTCIRDYIHVLDLAQAHLSALAYLDRTDRPHSVFNIGTGKGFSVLEVLRAIRAEIDPDISYEIEAPRPGDPPRLVADPSRANQILGWQSEKELKDIIQSHWKGLHHENLP